MTGVVSRVASPVREVKGVTERRSRRNNRFRMTDFKVGQAEVMAIESFLAEPLADLLRMHSAGSRGGKKVDGPTERQN